MTTNHDFSQAVSSNSVSLVSEFLRDGEPPCDYVLFLSIRRKANATLRVLLEAGADLNAIEHPKAGGCTPLMRSIHAKNMAAFRMLLKAGASINKGGSWETPLHVAAQEGSVDFAKACIAAGAKIDARDRAGNTPLMLAANMGHVGVVKSLLKAGANPLLLDRVRRTAYERAVANNHTEVVRLLEPVSRRRPPRLRGVPALIEAVSKQDMAGVEKWLSEGGDVNARDRRGRSPMSKAIELGAIPLVRKLVEAGMDLNKVSPDGTSFLESALRAEEWEIAKLLLQSGAVSNPPGNRVGDPINSAIYSDDVALIEQLVANGSNHKEPGVLLAAAAAKRLNVIQYLLSQGANPNATDGTGWTPLLWVLFDPRRKNQKVIGPTMVSAPKPEVVESIVRLLINHGADVNHADEQGRTPLSLSKSKVISSLLIKAGARCAPASPRAQSKKRPGRPTTPTATARKP